MNCETARDMWDKLHSVYEQKSEASLHLLQQRFYKYTKDQADDIATHISKLEELGKQLKQLGDPLSDSMMITKILMTLPQSYNHFYSAWDSTEQKKRTLSNLTSRLMMEESRLSAHEAEEDNSIALLAKKSFTEKLKVSERNDKKVYTDKNCRKPGKCNYCKKAGHWKKECRIRLKDERLGKMNSSKVNKYSSNGEAFIGETSANVTVKDEDKWYVDSGASDHMTSRRAWFVQFENFREPLLVRLGNGENIEACGKGDIRILAFAEGKWTEKHLSNVLYVPKIKINLFSSGAAMDKGFKMFSDDKRCEFIKNGRIAAVGVRHRRSYELNFKVLEPSNKMYPPVVNYTEKESLQLWHERLGHQNIRHVRKFLNQQNITVSDVDKNFFCDACILGKQHRLPFYPSNTKTTRSGEIIHCDVCGPMENKSINGSKYFVLFKDDFSRYRKVFFIVRKNEVKDKLKLFLKSIKVETGFNVKVLRTDNGSEFINNDVKHILEEQGIQHQRSVPYTPEQNGSAERDMRTVVEMARTMIHSKGLELKLWAEAVNTAVYVLNRTGTSSVEDKTPYELWFGKNVNYINFKIFGTVVFTHIPKQKRHKWDPKSKKGVFVGYSEDVKGYRVWYPETNQVNICRDVIFKGDNMINKNESDRYEFDNSKNESDSHEFDNSKNESDNSEIVTDKNEFEMSDGVNDESHLIGVDDGGNKDGTDNQNNVDEINAQKNDEQNQAHYELRNRRQIMKPDRLAYYNEIMAFAADCIDPATYEEAIKCNEAHKWKEAMDEEINSLSKNKTWKLVEIPSGRKAIDNKWVYRIKRKADGSIERFKARLVARGFSQKYGIDYKETFSPVVKFDSIRMILAIAAQEKMEMRQFDIKTAFLNGYLEEEIFMNQPKGYEDGSNRVCKLQRSLYGLKQAPRYWNIRFKTFLMKFNLQVSKFDPCIFIRHQRLNTLILAIYVDDGLIVANSKTDIMELLQHLKKEFEIKTSELNHFLGLEIKQEKDGTILVHQTGYINKILKMFHMQDCNTVSVPADPHQLLSMASNSTEESVSLKEVPYREAVGSLMYLAVATRPDIALAISNVSKYLEKHSSIHWNAVKRIFKYLKGTANYGLSFKHVFNVDLEAYSDADFAGDIDSRRSTVGYVFKFVSAAIAWTSRKQKSVALSTTESEYVAASETVKELVWLNSLKNELYSTKAEKPVVYIDNQSAIRLVKNPEFHKRTKHIDIKYHFIREKYEDNLFRLDYIASEDQIADILTKPLPKSRFEKLRTIMGVMKNEEETTVKTERLQSCTDIN